MRIDSLRDKTSLFKIKSNQTFIHSISITGGKIKKAVNKCFFFCNR